MSGPDLAGQGESGHGEAGHGDSGRGESGQGGSGAGATIHANAVLVGEAGILIRGPSGAGKSALSRTLVTQAAARGLFARHVADDRVRLEARAGRLLARPAPAIAGRQEVRGLGIVETPHEGAARIALVVDLVDGDPPRMPALEEQWVELHGLRVPRLAVACKNPNADLIFSAMQAWRIGHVGAE